MTLEQLRLDDRDVVVHPTGLEGSGAEVVGSPHAEAVAGAGLAGTDEGRGAVDLGGPEEGAQGGAVGSVLSDDDGLRSDLRHGGDFLEFLVRFLKGRG